MNLFILRHASAGTRRLNPLVDLKRPLDKEGKRHCLHLGMILNAMNLNFDLIVSSPLKRSLANSAARRHRDRLRVQDPHLKRARAHCHAGAIPAPAA